MKASMPDYKLRKAADIIKNLDNSDESNLIRYYIECKNDHIDELDEKIKEYKTFFRTLANFLNVNKNTIYK